MTKAEIVKDVASKTELTQSEVAAIVDEILDVIKGSVSKGEPVYLRGFGSFIIKRRATKTARIIKKGITITIPEHNIPAFKPSKEFTVK